MSLEAVNLTDAIGSEVRASRDWLLSPEGGAQVRKLLVERGVLLFPQLHLTDEEQVALAGNMGVVRAEGEKGIHKITLDSKVSATAIYLLGSFLWHMDGTHDDVPVFASLLTGRVLSKEGGRTLFANSYAAYEALPEEMKRRIEGLRIRHSFARSMELAGLEQTEEHKAYISRIPEKTHSLVWTHGTGRKSLVIGCHAAEVVGLPPAESDALIAELMDWITQPRFTYTHEWTVGDLLIWDNTGVLHRAEPYPLDSGRLMHRTTLLGEEAFA